MMLDCVLLFQRCLPPTIRLGEGQRFVISLEDEQDISKVKIDASELSTQELSEFMEIDFI